MNFNKLLNDSRARRVLGFLVAKGLLLHNSFEAEPSAKFTTTEALWVAENIEPRVLEVLPAVIINFPKAIIKKSEMPQKLVEVVRLIKKGSPEGPNLAGIYYKDMFRWANFQLPDKRTKPVKHKRRMKSFKFSPRALMKLKIISQKIQKSETEMLESLILNYPSK